MIVGGYRQFIAEQVPEYLSRQITTRDLETLKYLLHDKVDLYQPPTTSGDFALRQDHDLNVEMSKEYYENYAKLMSQENIMDVIFSRPERFYHGYRRAVNRIGPAYYSLKVEAAADILRGGKSIIYSNWIEFGIEPIIKVLNNLNISYRAFTGAVPISQRKEIVDDYNIGKFQVLIITKAGGEGLDLKEVRNVVVLDPPWNDAGLKQIIGRAIRYKSHEALDISERIVDVYKMSLVSPKFPNKPSLLSGDVILYGIINEKNKIHSALQTILESVSIETE